MIRVTSKQFWMDNYLKVLLDFCGLREKNKYDNLLIFDGDTGVGKTTLAIQCAYYYAETMGKDEFTVDHIFFDAEDLLQYGLTHRNKVLVWDEAAFEGMGTDWQNKNQQNLVKFMYTARKFGHFIIFIIPEIRKLQYVFAGKKSIALIRVYSPNKLKRGFWKGYSQDRKITLYNFEKKYNNFSQMTPNIRGNFTKNDENLIDFGKYEQKKDVAIAKIGQENSKGSVRTLDGQKILKLKEKGLTNRDIARALGCTPEYISQLINANK
jgi:hypothetical protein